MRRYSIIDPLYLSFFSKDLYRDVAASWKTGHCVLYLLSLLALCWIAGIAKFDAEFNAFVDDEVPRYVRQFPTVTIKNGIASIAEPQPYFIKDPDTDKPFMIIDTTGKVTTLADSTAAILLTATQLVLKDSGQGLHAVELKDLGDGTFDKTMLYGWFEELKAILAFIIYPFAVLFALAFRLVQALLYGFLGKAMSRGFRAPLPFATAFRIAAVALTPVIIVSTLISFFAVPIPTPWLLNFLLAFGYTLFGVKAATTNS